MYRKTGQAFDIYAHIFKIGKETYTELWGIGNFWLPLKLLGCGWWVGQRIFFVTANSSWVGFWQYFTVQCNVYVVQPYTSALFVTRDSLTKRVQTIKMGIWNVTFLETWYKLYI